jgi:hypothetical protein
MHKSLLQVDLVEREEEDAPIMRFIKEGYDEDGLSVLNRPWETRSDSI